MNSRRRPDRNQKTANGQRAGRIVALAVIAGLLAWPGASESLADETKAVHAFDRFIAIIAPLCQVRSSIDCADTAWSFADRDDDMTLSARELGRVKEDLKAWTLWKDKALPPPTRSGIFLGLLIAESIGVPRIIETYDADGDGRLTQDEVLQDVKLDERPLEKVLGDPRSFDRQAFAQRLGPMGNLLKAFE